MISSKKPLVSVIMNCYNGEEFLNESINSVFQQTFSDWEIVFWDNASSDLSAKIAKSYGSKLRYFNSEKNLILGKARNLASLEAKGKYLAFLDVDDVWYPNKLEDQLKVFNNSKNKLSFVYGKAEVLYQNNPSRNFIHLENDVLPSGDIFSLLARENFITFSSAIVDKKIFFECGGFPKHFKSATDYWIFLHMSKKYYVGSIQNICCQYRVHNNNTTFSHLIIGAKESIEALNCFKKDRNVKIGLVNHEINLAIMNIKEYQFINALIIIFKCGGWHLFFKRVLKYIKGFLL